MPKLSSLLWAFIAAAASPAAADELCGGTYMMHDVVETENGLSATLMAHNMPPPCFGEAIELLQLEVSYISDTVVRWSIKDQQNERWEVPSVVDEEALAQGSITDARQYTVEYETGSMTEPFQLKIMRAGGDGGLEDTLFDSQYLYFADQYIQYGTKLPNQANIYGLGERKAPMRYDTSTEQTYSFHASDHGTPDKKPLYGSHPFYLDVRQEKGAHGVFLLNSNPMDVVLGPDDLTYKVVGGVLDMFAFVGPTPSQVMSQYQTVIGNPFMPPLWSLGYHQCRWGYDNVQDIRDVSEALELNQVPTDVIWVDIDYMDNWKVFTTADAFQGLGDYVREVQAKGQHFVPIVDPGVKIEEGYFAYEDGLEKNVYVRDPAGNNHMGKVWPGTVFFPDWTHPNTSDWWTFHTREWHSEIPVDGMWTDMNEVASFCDGRCIMTVEQQDEPELFNCDCPLDRRFDSLQLDDPPYQPVDTRDRSCRALQDDIRGLDVGTLSMASQYYGGLEYNLHNLYGHFEAILTAETMKDIRGKRPFVLTRSTFAGTGKHAAHWLGDNQSSWDSLRASIAGVLNMNIFGIPLVGADVCGFDHDATGQLCQRWMQVGAFHPFYRNHNQEDAASQEPYVFGPEVLRSNIAVLHTRYELLPYFYTLFHEAHVRGGTVTRPLFFDFPKDPETYGIEYQWMVGPSLLVSPVVTENTEEVEAYFPNAGWYDFYTGKKTVARQAGDDTTSGSRMVLPTPYDSIQVHIRAGSVLPRQPLNGALTTTAQAGNPYMLDVALTDTFTASGLLYMDDGDSLDTEEKQAYAQVSWRVTGSEDGCTLEIQSSLLNDGYAPARDFVLDQIRILGAARPPLAVSLDENDLDVSLGWSSEGGDTFLTLSNLNLNIARNFHMVLDACPDNNSPAPGPGPNPDPSPESGDSGNWKGLAIGASVTTGVLIMLVICLCLRSKGEVGSGGGLDYDMLSAENSAQA